MTASTSGAGPRSHAAERAKQNRRDQFDRDLQMAMSQPQMGSIFGPDYLWPSGERWHLETTTETTTTNEPADRAG